MNAAGLVRGDVIRVRNGRSEFKGHNRKGVRTDQNDRGLGTTMNVIRQLLLAIAAALLLMPASSHAQMLEQLHSGDRIRLRLDGQFIVATLDTIVPDSVAYRLGNMRFAVALPFVERVDLSLHANKPILPYVAKGAGFGVAVGAIVGLIAQLTTYECVQTGETSDLLGISITGICKDTIGPYQKGFPIGGAIVGVVLGAYAGKNAREGWRTVFKQ